MYEGKAAALERALLLFLVVISCEGGRGLLQTHSILTHNRPTDNGRGNEAEIS